VFAADGVRDKFAGVVARLLRKTFPWANFSDQFQFDNLIIWCCLLNHHVLGSKYKEKWEQSMSEEQQFYLSLCWLHNATNELYNCVWNGTELLSTKNDLSLKDSQTKVLEKFFSFFLTRILFIAIVSFLSFFSLIRYVYGCLCYHIVQSVWLLWWWLIWLIDDGRKSKRHADVQREQ
jgi:hypothetical protein